MQEGTPYEITARHVECIERIAEEMREECHDGAGEPVIERVLSVSGGQGLASSRSSEQVGRSHLGEVSFYIVSPEFQEEPKVRTPELVADWRKRIGPILGAKELNFRAEIGRGGDPIDIELTGHDIEELAKASKEIKDHLKQYPDLFDITDSMDDTNDEIRLSVRPDAEHFGLTEADLARQYGRLFTAKRSSDFKRGATTFA